MLKRFRVSLIQNRLMQWNAHHDDINEIRLLIYEGSILRYSTKFFTSDNCYSIYEYVRDMPQQPNTVH